MTAAFSLLRSDRRARRFFAAEAQSAIGTGAAEVALLVLAYQRFHSAWAIALILLATFLPETLLSPLGGWAADRLPRRALLVGADVVRALAFAGVALSSDMAGMLACVFVAFSAGAFFTPACLAAVPDLVGRERAGAAYALQSAITNLGTVVGPACAAGLLVAGGPRIVMVVNAATFAVSALALASLPRFGRSDGAEDRAARASVRDALADPAVRLLLVATTLIVVSLGLLNVGELFLARDALGAGDAGLAVLVASCGAGAVAAALWGGRAGEDTSLATRYVVGIVLVAAGLLGAAAAPSLLIAAAAFALVGVGESIVVVNERRLLERLVAPELLGRVFGVERSLVSGAFGVTYVAAGVLAGALGARALFVCAGLAALAAAAWACAALRPTLEAWKPVVA